MKSFQVFFIWFILKENLYSYKFLAVLPTPSKSRYYIGQNHMKGLAEDGHDVTVISPFKEKTPIKNYKEVFLEHNWAESRKCNILPNFSWWNYCLFIFKINPYFHRHRFDQFIETASSQSMILSGNNLIFFLNKGNKNVSLILHANWIFCFCFPISFLRHGIPIRYEERSGKCRLFQSSYLVQFKQILL